MWLNYICGVIKCLIECGFEFNGVDIVVLGNVF